eukprot:TRINITY_DN104869_c0_g1_i1.p2 TRINITY_DN104869_c0_g1~~TRINITY_DN104869_c0_g1_i1.p2  ORF type:complete len:132 (-),score=8.37 TRINITY_DN104869_c0_g1_i1:45-440(-)
MVPKLAPFFHWLYPDLSGKLHAWCACANQRPVRDGKTPPRPNCGQRNAAGGGGYKYMEGISGRRAPAGLNGRGLRWINPYFWGIAQRFTIYRYVNSTTPKAVGVCVYSYVFWMGDLKAVLCVCVQLRVLDG